MAVLYGHVGLQTDKQVSLCGVYHDHWLHVLVLQGNPVGPARRHSRPFWR